MDNKFYISYRCVECDALEEKREVSKSRFDRAVEGATHKLETEGGDTEFSPVIKENEVVFYNALCKPCNDWYKVEDDKHAHGFRYGWSKMQR